MVFMNSQNFSQKREKLADFLEKNLIICWRQQKKIEKKIGGN